MLIETLELKNFRNYEQARFDFHRGTNILYGNNAQGKTNVLEALEVCATTRTHRGSRDAEMIRFGQEEAHLRLFYRKRDIPHKIDTHLRRIGKKGAAIDGSSVRRAAEVYGQIHLVSFFPEDMGIIKNSPKERRRFLDSQLCQLERVYVAQLAEYNKALMQRNALLKDTRFGEKADAMLDVWDEQLLRLGSSLIDQRRRFLEELDILVKEIHRELTEGKEEIALKYEPNVTAEDFARQLYQNRERDLRLKQSSTGPHRDDFQVIVNGNDLRHYGSQGQQRSAALSLKLSEIDLVKERTHDMPVLLLDDVLSELDGSRQKKLLESIEKTQTFLTCTGMDELIGHQFQVDRVFHIEDGKIKEDS